MVIPGTYLASKRAAPPTAPEGCRIASMIAKDLLDLLACPVCKAPLTIRSEEALRCAQCKVVYPIRDGIPILLKSESAPEQ